jgi:hypothetical protein
MMAKEGDEEEEADVVDRRHYQDKKTLGRHT